MLSRIKTATTLEDFTEQELVQLMQLLLSHETKPGGPYIFHTQEDAALNKKVSWLLHESTEKKRSGAVTSKTLPNKHLWQDILLEVLEGAPPFAKNSPMLRTLNTLHQHLRRTDQHGEITRLSTLFLASLRTHHAISPANEAALASANARVWFAYSIYDQIVDRGRYTALLPIARSLEQAAFSAYLQVFSQGQQAQNVTRDIQHLFARTNEATLREVFRDYNIAVHENKNSIKIRALPNSTQLWDDTPLRSIAHVLGPYLIAKYVHKSPQHEEVLQALSNYCAARQLCDDIHDWKEDLLNGRLTYVHACLFFEAGIKEGTLPLDKLIQTLETQFFRTTLAFLLEEVEQLAANACEVLESTILVPNSTFTEAFIAPLIRTAKEGLAQHTRNRLLLRAIKKAL